MFGGGGLHCCIEAKDGQDARGWLEGGHPVELIVTDQVQMPRVTGLELSQGFKESKKHRSLSRLFFIAAN